MILEIARRHVPVEMKDALDGTGASLRDAGITSLAMVGLICDVEQSFGIVFPSDAIDESTFRSAQTIAVAVAALRSQPPE